MFTDMDRSLLSAHVFGGMHNSKNKSFKTTYISFLEFLVQFEAVE